MSTAPRPARESLGEIASLASLTFSVGFAALWIASRGDAASLWSVAVDAGAAVLDQLGWAFGVYVPTLLGFYVLVTGEQLGQGSNAGRLRRLLGGVAELSFAALLPGLVLVAIYCVSDVSNIGALFVILPATFMLGFLTAELGAFVVFDVSVQLADATRTRERSIMRLQVLRRRSRRPVILVMAVTMVTGILLGTLVVGVTGHWAWLTQWQTLAIIGSWAVFTSAGGMLAALGRAKPGRLEHFVAIGGVVLAWVLFGWVALSPEASRLWPIIAGAAAIACFVTGSALWPVRRGPRLVVDWCLAGAGATIAARSTVRLYRRSAYRIAELQHIMAGSERVSLRQRLASMQALVVDRLAARDHPRRVSEP